MEFIYRWHPIKAKQEGILTIELRQFMNEECLRGRQQWEYINNKCLWYIQKKINIKYQPKIKNREEEVYIVNLVAKLTVLCYTLSRFWRNSAEFSRNSRFTLI